MSALVTRTVGVALVLVGVTALTVVSRGGEPETAPANDVEQYLGRASSHLSNVSEAAGALVGHLQKLRHEESLLGNSDWAATTESLCARLNDAGAPLRTRGNVPVSAQPLHALLTNVVAEFTAGCTSLQKTMRSRSVRDLDEGTAHLVAGKQRLDASLQAALNTAREGEIRGTPLFSYFQAVDALQRGDAAQLSALVELDDTTAKEAMTEGLGLLSDLQRLGHEAAKRWGDETPLAALSDSLSRVLPVNEVPGPVEIAGSSATLSLRSGVEVHFRMKGNMWVIDGTRLPPQAHDENGPIALDENRRARREVQELIANVESGRIAQATDAESAYLEWQRAFLLRQDQRATSGEQ